jgi:hypothetical protein
MKGENKRGAIRMVLDSGQMKAACQRYVEQMFSVTEHCVAIALGSGEAVATITKRRQRKAKAPKSQPKEQ